VAAGRVACDEQHGEEHERWSRSYVLPFYIRLRGVLKDIICSLTLAD
jgi:hypothetical protein